MTRNLSSGWICGGTRRSTRSIFTFTRSSPTPTTNSGDAAALALRFEVAEGVGRALVVSAIGEHHDALHAVVQLLVDDAQERVAQVGAAQQAVADQLRVEVGQLLQPFEVGVGQRTRLDLRAAG